MALLREPFGARGDMGVLNAAVQSMAAALLKLPRCPLRGPGRSQLYISVCMRFPGTAVAAACRHGIFPRAGTWLSAAFAARRLF